MISPMKRKHANSSPQAPPKKPRTGAAPPSTPAAPTKQPASTPLPLSQHEPVLKTLSTKYDVLPLSVISSTSIGTRVTRAVGHITGEKAGDGEKKIPVILFHARAADAGKLISVVEKSKEVLGRVHGKGWFQYNKLFVSEEKPKTSKKGKIEDVSVIEETILGDEDGEDDEVFEAMKERFKRAVETPKERRDTKALSIYLAGVSVPELRTMEGVTVQTSEEEKI